MYLVTTGECIGFVWDSGPEATLFFIWSPEWYAEENYLKHIRPWAFFEPSRSRFVRDVLGSYPRK